MELISTNGKLLGCYQEDFAKFEEISKHTRGIIDLYQVEHLHPYIALTYYLEECLGHASQGRAAAALGTLKGIVRLLESKSYPFSLEGDAYFNLVDEWINSQLTLGAHLPSSEELVKGSIHAFFKQHPSFTDLFADNDEFQLLMKRLVSCLT